MKIQALAGAAALALIAGGAMAATGGNYAAPSQPVAYSKLDSYLKASPAKRRKEDFSLHSTSASNAPIGGSADTSATTTAPAAPAAPATSAGMMPAQGSTAPASAPDNSAGTDAGGAAGAQAAPPAPSQTPPATQTPADQSGAPAATTAPTTGAAPDTGAAKPGT
ncbi:MAG TPA: hypothetical protein VGI95_01435 [Caulobacteraceae bacterium]|jgi:hypothetical protein